MSEIRFSGLRQVKPAGCALQQCHAQTLFQLRHFRAHGGIRHTQYFGRLAETPRLNDFDKDFDAIKSHRNDSTLYGTMFPNLTV